MLGLTFLPSSVLGLFLNFFPPSKAVTALCSLPSESSFLTAKILTIQFSDVNASSVHCQHFLTRKRMGRGTDLMYLMLGIELGSFGS